MPKVSVIIVNWNRNELLFDCIQSLRNQTFQDFEVIVVDNGSKPKPLKIPGCRMIYNSRNWGFAGGVNTGIEVAYGEFIALLNNDARANKHWLQELVSATYDGGGMWASNIIRKDGSIESMGCYVYPDGNGMCRRGYDHSVDFPSGCAAMYRRSMLEKIGLFDESFFMYNEDTEIGIRAQRGNWFCRYVPTAVVTHLGSQSTSRNSLKKLYYVERNRIKIMLKHFTFWQIVKSIPWTVKRYMRGGR
jgi:GT2 family glycosyltransferase